VTTQCTLVTCSSKYAVQCFVIFGFNVGGRNTHILVVTIFTGYIPPRYL